VAQQLESLVEQYNPDYDRKLKQRTKEVWGPKLMKSEFVSPTVHCSISLHSPSTSQFIEVAAATVKGTLVPAVNTGWCPHIVLCCADGLFNLVDYSVHANPLPMRNAKETVELLEALPYIRVDMDGHTKEAFKKQLQALLETHYEQGKFDFPLETKLFILKPVNSRESADKLHHSHEGKVPFQFPNRPT